MPAAISQYHIQGFAKPLLIDFRLWFAFMPCKLPQGFLPSSPPEVRMRDRHSVCYFCAEGTPCDTFTFDGGRPLDEQFPARGSLQGKEGRGKRASAKRKGKGKT